MNYDLMTLIEYFIGAFSCCFGGYIVGRIILQEKSKNKKIIDVLLLITLAVIAIVNSMFLDNIMKIFGSILILSCIYKFIFNQKFVKSMLLGVITYITVLCGDATFALLVSIIMAIFDVNLTAELSTIILSNIIVTSFSVIYTILFKKLIFKILKYVDKNNVLYIFIIGVILSIVILSSLYNLSFSNLIIGYKFILNTLIIIGSIILVLVLVSQYLKNKQVIYKYNMLEEYLKNSAELIEKYSSTLHRYKNNLIIVKGYINSDIHEANRYIDELLDNHEVKKYKWISKINYINLEIIKYLIYYKLSRAEEFNLKISVNVSLDIKDYDFGILSLEEGRVLLDILGEYFDNALYASNESKDKELNFDLYIDDGNIVFLIANTYNREINLSLVTKNGYTTKGKGHGFGLYDIDKTLKKYFCFNSNYEILNNYFVVKLVIKKQ